MALATQNVRRSDPIAAQVIQFVELWQEFRVQQLSVLDMPSEPDSALELDDAIGAALASERKAA